MVTVVAGKWLLSSWRLSLLARRNEAVLQMYQCERGTPCCCRTTFLCEQRPACCPPAGSYKPTGRHHNLVMVPAPKEDLARRRETRAPLQGQEPHRKSSSQQQEGWLLKGLQLFPGVTMLQQGSLQPLLNSKFSYPFCSNWCLNKKFNSCLYDWTNYILLTILS